MAKIIINKESRSPKEVDADYWETKDRFVTFFRIIDSAGATKQVLMLQEKAVYTVERAD